MELTYSVEEELLGTLGPFGRLQHFFEGVDPVLLVNGDSLCRWPVDKVASAHQEAVADATLLLSASADPEKFGGGVVVDGDGRVLSFRGRGAGQAGTRVGVFAGLHLVSSPLVTGIEARPADIVRDLYEPLLEQGALLRAVFTRRRWDDLGTPARYLSGVLAAALALAGADSEDATWCGDGVEVDSGARIRNSVLEHGVTVEAGATIGNSLILPGARIGRGAQVEDSILAPGVELAAGARVISRLLSRRDGRDPEVVETPIEGRE